jgi:excisionase family DNA binding protein
VSGKILTVAQVADLVQLSERTVMRAINAGHLEASGLAQGRGGWRVYEDAIPRWMQTRSNQRREPRTLADVAATAAANPSAARRPRTGHAAGRLTVTPDMGSAGMISS